MRKSARELLADVQRKTKQKAAPPPTDFQGLFELLLGGPALHTQSAFVRDPHEGKAYMGPIGCAKTSTICSAGLLRALLQPGSKGLVCRNDYNDLEQTTKLRMEEMLSRLPEGVRLDRNKSAPENWWIRTAARRTADGGIEEGEPSLITFMGLKDGLGSLELNWAIVDEAVECNELIVREISGRFRNAGGNYSLMMAFNPPDKNHWLYTACTGMDSEGDEVAPPWLKLFLPQPRENVDNLPTNYYEDRSKHFTAEQIETLVKGNWGGVFEGQPVYRAFNPKIHCKTGLTYTGDRPLLRFWDFGYNRPHVLFVNVTKKGHIQVVGEVAPRELHARALAQRVKLETSHRYPNASKVLDFGDPAVTQRKDTGSALKDLYVEGIVMRYRHSKIKEGVDLIRYHLNRLIDGEAALQFDRDKAPGIIASLSGGYRMNDKGTEPKKDGVYDHAADSFRYGILHVMNGISYLEAQSIHDNVSYQGNADPFNHPQSLSIDPDTYDSNNKDWA